MDIKDLPTLNASLNMIAAVFLLLGRHAIKGGDKKGHRKWMLAALSASAAFLACYLYYHYNVAAVTTYEGVGFWRVVYFFVLATHVPLATLMVPFIIYAVVLAVQQKFERHQKIVRWVWPVWMYVSVTGVLVYLMLYVF